jgi:uncharacterized protein
VPELIPSLGLAGAGLIAGMMNALAGGGGFILLPALMMAGATAIQANVTGSVAVWPGALVTMFAYRQGLGTNLGKSLPWYVLLVLIGSLSGSILLLYTSNEVFVRLLPWLLLGATLLFLMGPRITQAVRKKRIAIEQPNPSFSKSRILFIGMLMTLIAIYGGYFGGGMGIMTLAALSILGLEDIYELNAVKSILVFSISSINVLYFILQDAVAWKLALPMLLGNLVGGYVASHWARGLPRDTLRMVISGICMTITVAYFYKAFG